MPVARAEGNDKPKKRALTQARRDQNRAAQRAWRQRQREQKKIAVKGNDKPIRLAPKSTGPTSTSSSPVHYDYLTDRRQAPSRDALRAAEPQNINDSPVPELYYSPKDKESSSENDRSLSEKHHEGSSPEVLDDDNSQSALSVFLHSEEGQQLLNKSPSTSTSYDTLVTNSLRTLQLKDTLHVLNADPVINTLQTQHSKTLLALLNNALCLGFDIHKLMTCRKTYMSPFFRTISPTDNPQDLVASTLNQSIPIHLQPTMAQILVPHHASLDLIPLPLLRERIIMLAFAMPQVFDLWDFKLDIYIRHALTMKLDGERLPWDRRCWEMKGWFGKKWGPFP
ncbi:hypothetical protein N7510_009693 [Penicillium lagena]|uniref:uncharacterized protein n=1 Tax=Penicillium lagena TaxID=94218 RepID=UPI002540F588|nr:uncharacterized protein N7510_009693 [Penicillium lagena]KAJ5604539.1 hypothetical protein N7510_009693 [Penicillium lagena]